MRCTVIWKPTARAELARIWMSASDRAAVTQASSKIDKRLLYSPETAGRPIGSERYLIEAPLVVLFSVDPDDRKVEVTKVGRW